MSGGYFRHTNAHISIIADDIRDVISSNYDKNQYGESREYSEETLAKLQATVNILSKASAMVRMIDYLLAGDTGEESFNRRWHEELDRIKEDS